MSLTSAPKFLLPDNTILSSSLTSEERLLFIKHFPIKLTTWPWQYPSILEGKTIQDLIDFHYNNILYLFTV
jgi:hypothetical protein